MLSDFELDHKFEGATKNIFLREVRRRSWSEYSKLIIQEASLELQEPRRSVKYMLA